MDIRKLQRLVVDALEDVKGADIRVFNSTGLTQLFDRVIIASGTSNRQTKALAASVRDKVKAAGGHVVSVEGADTGEWVLVDLGDAIVHVMQPAIRTYYNLEEIWGAKPISLKSLDEADAVLARSAASRQAAATDPERTIVARKTAAKKSITGKAASAGAPRKPVAGTHRAAPQGQDFPAVEANGSMTTEDALDGTVPMSVDEQTAATRADTRPGVGTRGPARKLTVAKVPTKVASTKVPAKKVAAKKSATGSVVAKPSAKKAVDRRSAAKKTTARPARAKTTG